MARYLELNRAESVPRKYSANVRCKQTSRLMNKVRFGILRGSHCFWRSSESEWTEKGGRAKSSFMVTWPCLPAIRTWLTPPTMTSVLEAAHPGILATDSTDQVTVETQSPYEKEAGSLS